VAVVAERVLHEAAEVLVRFFLVTVKLLPARPNLDEAEYQWLAFDNRYALGHYNKYEQSYEVEQELYY